jgi:uncharacterized protein
VAQEVATLDLRSLDLAPGAAARLRVRVPPVELRLGGQRYVADPSRPEVELQVSRSLSGIHLRLRTEVDLVGPCWRCLGPSRTRLAIDTSEIAAEGRPPDAPIDEELESAYVEDHVLRIGEWARDAIAEAVPPTILCREDCAGLCPVCGADRNAGDCGCAQEEVDSRWDALRELSERLRRET